MDKGSRRRQESFFSTPFGAPDELNVSRSPARSIAAIIALALLAIGVRRPFSNSRTVDIEMPASRDRSSCFQSSHARAARHCSGLMTMAVKDNFLSQRQRPFVGFRLIAARN